MGVFFILIQVKILELLIMTSKYLENHQITGISQLGVIIQLSFTVLIRLLVTTNILVVPKITVPFYLQGIKLLTKRLIGRLKLEVMVLRLLLTLQILINL